MAAPQLSPISLNQLLRLGLSPAALHNLGAGLLVGCASQLSRDELVADCPSSQLSSG
jgi:hypothetical protein